MDGFAPELCVSCPSSINLFSGAYLPLNQSPIAVSVKLCWIWIEIKISAFVSHIRQHMLFLTIICSSFDDI
jgi:hypothetical protein